MLPEKHIQEKVADDLKKAGWIVIRAGFDGYPDIIALHPSGYGRGWFPGKKKRGAWHIRWKSRVPLCPSGVNLTADMPGTKLFLEFKKEGGGVLNPRQGVYLKLLSVYGIAEVISDINASERLLGIYPDGVKS